MLYLFYVWCASVAGDTKNYITAAKSKDDVLALIDSWLRHDYEIRYASSKDITDFGYTSYEDFVVFPGGLFEYNNKTNRYEYDPRPADKRGLCTQTIEEMMGMSLQEYCGI